MSALGLGAAFAYDVESDGIRYNIIDGPALEVTSKLPIEFPGQKPEELYSGDIVIPSDIYVDGYGRLSVVSIGAHAFSFSDVPSVTLPASIRQMGQRAFYCCSLQEIDLSKTLISELPLEAFLGCERLESVKLPDVLKSIGIMAFMSTAIKTLQLPDSVEAIESTAFVGTPLERLIMNNSLRSIGDQAFSSTPLKTVSWSENLATICWGAFEGSSLAEIILPPTIIYIDGMAFGDMNSLSRVVCMVDNPSDISINDWAFFQTDLSRCTLEVPAESLTLYENAPVWCEFGHIVPYKGASIVQPEISGEICVKVCDEGLELLSGHTDVVIYDPCGRMVYSGSRVAESNIIVPLPAGIYIVKNRYSAAKFCVN